MVNRVGTAAQHDLMMSNIKLLQSRVSETMIQASSGKAASRYSGIAPDAKRLVGLEATHAQLSQYVANNQIVDQRLQSMETNTSQLLDIASQFKALLVQASSSGNAPNMGLDITAQTLLNQVGALLNVQLDGRYLFAGSATNSPAVDLNDPGMVAPPGTYPSTANTTYYQGDDVALSTKAGPELDIAYGIRADEAGFEGLIRSLKLVATAVLSPNPDTARLSEALDVVNQAIQDIPQTIADRVRDYSVKAFEAVGGEGFARVDFFLVGDHLVVNEINTIPGFTAFSMFPLLWEASGVPYPDLIERLIRLALERPLGLR